MLTIFSGETCGAVPGAVSLDVLESGISCNAELWGILQPYQHLICGRNSSGQYTSTVTNIIVYSNEILIQRC